MKGPESGHARRLPEPSTSKTKRVLNYLGEALNGRTSHDNFGRLLIAPTPIYFLNLLEGVSRQPITPRETWDVLGSILMAEMTRQAILSFLRRRGRRSSR